MSDVTPYRLVEPRYLTCAAVFNSPHSGRRYIDALIRRSRLERLQLRASEDAFVDRLF